MKLYIIGHVASGKTTLAREISARLGVPCFHLDEIVYMPDGSSPLGNRKRTPEDRDALFCEIISRHDWIIEDVGRECFSRGLLEADEVVLHKRSAHSAQVEDSPPIYTAKVRA